MGTRPRTDDQDRIKDAEDIYRRSNTIEAKRAIAEADKERKKKLFRPGFFKEYAAALKQVRPAKGASAGRKVAMKSATRAEIAARKKLYKTLTGHRATIKDAYDSATAEDQSIREAFGVGVVLKEQSTPGLLSAAEGMISALEDLSFGPRARDAGIGAAARRSLEAERDALAKADSSQGEAISERKALTKTKNALIAKLDAFKTKVRSAMKIAARDNAALLAKFESRIVRKKPAKRAPKAAAVAAIAIKK